MGDDYIIVDGFDRSSNTIYEYLGSFWHGNPSIYKSEDINPRTKSSFGSLYQKTMNRIKNLEDMNYKVIFEWSPR